MSSAAKVGEKTKIKEFHSFIRDYKISKIFGYYVWQAWIRTYYSMNQYLKQNIMVLLIFFSTKIF